MALKIIERRLLSLVNRSIEIDAQVLPRADRIASDDFHVGIKIEQPFVRELIITSIPVIDKIRIYIIRSLRNRFFKSSRCLRLLTCISAPVLLA